MADVLQRQVDGGAVPGAVALVARGDRAEVTLVGSADTEGHRPLTRDAIFRLASVTKPIVAAAVMMLVNFSLPAVAPLIEILAQGPLPPTTTPDEWTAALAGIPMLHRPGEAWLYNTGSDVLGVLIARLTGCPLPEFLHERIFGPLGMADTGFSVPASARHRLVGYYRRTEDGVELVDGGAGPWSRRPAFPSGAGGLVSTADDWWAFGRMLLGAGPRLLSPESVDRMTTDHLTAAQRAASTLFLEGQGWGYGGAVDVAELDPWNAPGRYGWVGGTGTAAHVVPSTGTVTVLLTQMEMTGPTPPPVMRDFWTAAAG